MVSEKLWSHKDDAERMVSICLFVNVDRLRKQLKEGQKIIGFTPGLCETDMTANFLTHIKRYSA